MHDCDAINRFQRIMLDAYASAEYRHVTSHEEAEQAGDTLFLFLFRELSTREDCTSLDTARRRIYKAAYELQLVAQALAAATVYN